MCELLHTSPGAQEYFVGRWLAVANDLCVVVGSSGGPLSPSPIVADRVRPLKRSRTGGRHAACTEPSSFLNHAIVCWRGWTGWPASETDKCGTAIRDNTHPVDP